MNSYAKQILWEAVGSLATGDGSIQERLIGAAGGNGSGLVKIAHRAHEYLHDDNLAEFNAIYSAVSGGGHDLRTTVGHLTNAECRELAQRIFSLFVDVMGGL
jgi:hypothetical protein